VLLHGDSLYRRTPTQRADAINQHIGFVFQRASLLPELSVWDNIAIKYRLRNAPEPSAMIDHWLTVFQLSNFRDASPATLSGGQGHRVAFIRALLNTPTVLLCDEPTGNLDDANTACLLDAIQTIRTETPCAVVIATHDARIAQIGDTTVDLTPCPQ
jgi:putative ABC transport system ATP-binding protein